jgi:hypothetical protein
MRKVMDEKKILLVNLSKGRIGESNANLLGSMLITKLYLSALSRADVSKAEMKELPNFYVYVDEFQSFANDSFANILSEARKYKLNLTIAHQYIEQMSDEVRAAVFGNVGTMISFRVGSYDGEVLEKEFAPTFTAEDIVNLGFAQIYLRLMIDGIGSHPFSAKTLPPLELPEKSFKEEIIGYSRQNFAYPRLEVETFIKNLHSDKEESANGQNENGNRNNQGNNGNSSGKNNGDRNRKKDNGKNGGVKNYDNGGGGQNNSAPRKPKTKPVIDPEKKSELQAQLKSLQERKKMEAKLIEEDNGDGEDLKGISLKDLTLNTQSGANHRNGTNGDGGNHRNQKKDPAKKDLKNPSPENKNSLKEALAGILGDIQKSEPKPAVEPKEEKPIEKPAEKIKKKEEKSDQKKTESEPKPEKNSQQNPKQNESKKETNEIPEDELRRILEV